MEGGLKKSVEARPAVTPEVASSPEQSREVAPEQQVESSQEERVQDQVVQAAPVAAVPAGPVAPPKDPQLKQIEDVLAEGLSELYQSLPPNVQPTFKAKGEEVARQINAWAREAKLVAKNVLGLIREWLGLAPRLNKHYLEQESKIKTDRIMQLAESGDPDLLV